MNRPMRSFLGLSIPALILCAMAGVLLGTGGYTAYYAEGLSYLSSDPRQCINCHIMRDHYDGWLKSSHHAVATCNDCHAPHELIPKYMVKAENGLWHSKAFTLQEYRDPLVIRPKNSRVLQKSCLHCHGEVAAAALGHGLAEDGGAANCVRCHASVGHGPAK